MSRLGIHPAAFTIHLQELGCEAPGQCPEDSHEPKVARRGLESMYFTYHTTVYWSENKFFRLLSL